MIRNTLSIATALTCAAVLHAQNACPNGGLGGIEAVFDLDGETGTDGQVGVQRIGDRYYVTARRRNAVAMHRVWVLDEAGRVIPGAGFDQPSSVAATDWGVRDLTTDGVALFGASDLGVVGFDTTGAPCTTIVTANGLRPFAGPVAGAARARLGVMRALAFDSEGNGGEGSFWAANLGSELVEFDLSGNVLRAHANTRGWSIQGLALDPCARTLWGYAMPDGGAVVEIDLANGAVTGRSIDALSRGAQAGLCTFVDGATRRLAWIVQGPTDQLVVATLHAVAGVCDAPRLTWGVDGGARDSDYGVVDAMAGTVELALAGGAPGTPGVVFVNLGGDALACGDVTWLGGPWRTLQGFVATTPFSVPTGVAVAAPLDAGTVLSLPVSVLPQSAAMRAQAVFLVPAFAVVPTNEVEWVVERRALAGVEVTVEGHDSLVADQDGFFRVRNDGNDAIVRLELKAVGGMVFDYAQQTTDGALWAGESGACRGTYRNGSDAASGLDYGATPAAGCDATARRGFLESGVRGETLTFVFRGGRFRGGAQLAFDCDTDGGKGASARAMDGMRVRVTFASGAVRSGVVRADPSGAQRAGARL